VYNRAGFRKSLTNTCKLQSYFVKTPPAGRAAEAAAPPPRAPAPATDTLDAALAAATDAMEAERDGWRTETLQRWKSLRPRGPRIFGATSVPCVRIRQTERVLCATPHFAFVFFAHGVSTSHCAHASQCGAVSSAVPSAALHEGWHQPTDQDGEVTRFLWRRAQGYRRRGRGTRMPSRSWRRSCGTSLAMSFKPLA